MITKTKKFNNNKIVIIISIILVGLIAIVITANGCNEEKEDITKDVNKNGSVESSITVDHLTDSLDVIITKHQVWNNNYVTKEFYHRDTVSALGMHTTVAEDGDGNEKTVEVKKDYEIYITVK